MFTVSFTKSLSISRHSLIFSLSILMIGCNNASDTTSDFGNKDIITDINADYNQQLAIDSDNLSIDLPISCQNDDIVQAFNEHESGMYVKGCGKVDKVLDNSPKTHVYTVYNDSRKAQDYQRFAVQLGGIEPVMIVTVIHNINESSTIENLQKGDEVIFYGEYNYNQAGGIVHRTYEDSATEFKKGWVEKDGERTQ